MGESDPASANNVSRPASWPAMSAAVSQALSSEQSPSFVGAKPGAKPAYAWVAKVMEQEEHRLLGMLWRMLGREADVLDAFQDCFCRLAGRAHRLNPQQARAYVYRTASNIALDVLRGRARREQHQPAIRAARAEVEENRHAGDAGAGPADNVEQRHRERQQLREAMGELPPHLRSVIVLRDLGQLSYQEVGRILQIDPTTARVYRRHAVVRLGELMQGEAS